MRAARVWRLSFSAACVEAGLQRADDGRIDDSAHFEALSQFFQRSLDGFEVVQALIEDRPKPVFSDTGGRLSDFRYAARVLPADVQSPSTLLARYRDLAQSFATKTATPAMTAEMLSVAQRVRSLARNMVGEILAGVS